MNYDQEQAYELEALSEIYFNEIKVISRSPMTFSIRVRPQAARYEESETDDGGGSEESEDDDESDDYGSESDGNSVYSLGESNSNSSDADDSPVVLSKEPFLELKFTLPPRYPDERPSVELLNSNDLSEHELSKALNNLNLEADESLGSVMIFKLVCDLVEWLASRPDRDVPEIDDGEENIATITKDVAELEEKIRVDGTPVTVESFTAWKARFDAEMLKAKLDSQKGEQATSGGTRRLTGREMFELDRTLVESDLNFVEDLDQDQLEALLHNIDEVNIQDDFEPDLELGSDVSDNGDGDGNEQEIEASTSTN